MGFIGIIARTKVSDLLFYICDRKKKCHQSAMCGTQCFHTADESHALYKEHTEFNPVYEIGQKPKYFEVPKRTKRRSKC